MIQLQCSTLSFNGNNHYSFHMFKLALFVSKTTYLGLKMFITTGETVGKL